MCRLFAWPPGFSRLEAINIMKAAEGKNKDGVGTAYVKNGEFVIEKWDKELKWVLNNAPLLSHMPSESWTIGHLRLGSHGKNCIENTHPFYTGNWCIAHNGTWFEHDSFRDILQNFIVFQGETDSEVAAHVIDLIGVKKFSHRYNHGGVFLCLNINGSLCLIKNSGEVCGSLLKDNQILLGSELPDRYKHFKIDAGWYKFSSNGKYSKGKQKQEIKFKEKRHSHIVEIGPVKVDERTDRIIQPRYGPPKISKYDLSKLPHKYIPLELLTN